MKGRQYVLGVCVLVALFFIGAWYTADRHAIAMTVSSSPAWLYADGTSSAVITVRVTEPDGTPRAGDTILSLRMDGQATLRPGRVKTDTDGVARFQLMGYQENDLQKAGFNHLAFSDASVGIIVGVYKRTYFAMEFRSPPQDAPSQTRTEVNDSNTGGYFEIGY